MIEQEIYHAAPTNDTGQQEGRNTGCDIATHHVAGRGEDAHRLHDRSSDRGPTSQPGSITLGELLARLGDMLANLENYVERRAVMLARPVTERIQAEAKEHVMQAERRVQWVEDLNAELRRQLDAATRTLDRLIKEDRARKAQAAAQYIESHKS